MKTQYFFNSLIVLSLLTTSCAPLGSSDSDIEQQVARQDMQLRQMQPQQADAMNQIQAMRQEIKDLKAQLNDLNNAGGTKEIAERIRQHDMALRKVDNNMSLDLDLGSPMDAPRYSPEVVSGSDNSLAPVPMTGMQGIQLAGAPDSSAYGAARTVTPSQPAQTYNSYGLPPDNPVQEELNDYNGPSESKWGQADPTPTLVIPQKDISLALFDAGVNAFNSRNYVNAERSFSDFLKNYPSHSQAAEAQFYLAECDFNQNEFSKAALAYEDVIKKFPKSSSAPEAYLKQAICFSKMKETAAARARMQEIIKKFPNSAAATRAKAFLQANK